MFGIGMPEFLIILVVALIVVGPKRLPDLAKTLGKGLREFRSATDGIKDELMQNESFRDLQDVKKDFKDTFDSVNPTKFIEAETKSILDPKKPDPDYERRRAVYGEMVAENAANENPTTSMESGDDEPAAIDVKPEASDDTRVAKDETKKPDKQAG